MRAVTSLHGYALKANFLAKPKFVKHTGLSFWHYNHINAFNKSQERFS